MSTEVSPAPDHGITQILRDSGGHLPPVVPQAGRTWLDLPLFASLTEDGRAALRSAMAPVSFARGQALLRQGAIGHDMFVLDEGAVQVCVRGDDGAVSFQRVIQAPAILGEMALVTHEPRSATVVAETDVRTLRMDKATLDALFARSPDAAKFLTTMVGERLLEGTVVVRPGLGRHVVSLAGIRRRC